LALLVDGGIGLSPSSYTSGVSIIGFEGDGSRLAMLAAAAMLAGG
jgi:hypothetical protein